MAQYEDMTIDQGTDVVIEIRLGNPDGSKKDLTGYWVESQMRETFNTRDSDAISFFAYVNDPLTEGVITLSLTNAQTRSLEASRYLYDINLIYFDSDSDKYVERILEGQVHVKPAVTRL